MHQSYRLPCLPLQRRCLSPEGAPAMDRFICKSVISYDNAASKL